MLDLLKSAEMNVWKLILKSLEAEMQTWKFIIGVNNPEIETH